MLHNGYVELLFIVVFLASLVSPPTGFKTELIVNFNSRLNNRYQFSRYLYTTKMTDLDSLFFKASLIIYATSCSAEKKPPFKVDSTFVLLEATKYYFN